MKCSQTYKNKSSSVHIKLWSHSFILPDEKKTSLKYNINKGQIEMVECEIKR